MKVFLSGGTHGDWQDRVMAACSGAAFFDPRTLGRQAMDRIASIERQWLDECDVLFVYLEATNPSGLGSAFEMGYAIANSKPVIFVDEKRTTHTEWLGVHCLKTFFNLEEGITLLDSLVASGKVEHMNASVERKYIELPPETMYQRLKEGHFEALAPRPLRDHDIRPLAKLMANDKSTHEALLLATTTQPRRWFDWNVGYLIPHLNPDWLAEVLLRHGPTLYRSEGIAWGLGELGSENEDVINFLFKVCEECADYDAWWCAAVALEKLRSANSIDLLKRTLKGEKWNNLSECLQNLHDRSAAIGVLRLVTMDNLQGTVIPHIINALDHRDYRVVQNAIWLLERLRVNGKEVLDKLFRLFQSAQDVGHSLSPRIIEAFGEIASDETRELLEDAVRSARYFRTRAYAAKGLGLIADTRSLAALEEAFAIEEDSRVVDYISDAICAIRDVEKRELSQVRRKAGWPENGMIVDESNEWYANPEVYEVFSKAEDPENVAFKFAASLIPAHSSTVLDVGTGTGRFAKFLSKECPGLRRILALDSNFKMLGYFKRESEAFRGQQSVGYLQAGMESIPLRDSCVDAVVSSWGFPSNMWNPDLCLRQVKEVYRVLREGGILITIGWDESFQDELSEMWYRHVPEPDFRRESLDEWRRRRRTHIASPRNCYLTFVKQNIRVPVKFGSINEAAYVLGHLFGFGAGDWVIQTRRREFSMLVGITCDSRSSLENAVCQLQRSVQATGM